MGLLILRPEANSLRSAQFDTNTVHLYKEILLCA